jgi:putative FmdB family regulatory protein
MPTYEYKCRDCAEKFDEFQKITDPPLTRCPLCGGMVDRLISGGSGIMFKGSGFYITDYRSASYKKAAESEKSADLASKAKSDIKPSSDSQPKSDSPTKSANKPKKD